MRALVGLSMAVLWSVAAAHTSHAATYWVATTGDNTYAGTQAAPWRTLQYAADRVNAGDTVRVLDGDYQGFYLERSGTAANPITFRAEGAAVRITQDNPRTPDGINVENAAYAVIDGFVVDNRTRAGVRSALAHHITIRNCRLGYNGRWGILTGFVDDVLIENNEAHHSIAEHGIYVSNSGDRPVIRNNWVHDNFANGIHMNGDRFQGGDGTISGALVEGNVINNNGTTGSGINMDGVVDSVVRNNLIYDNHNSGISLYRIDGQTGSTNNLVINNTILNASNGRWCINIVNASTGTRIRNNILYNAHAFRGAITADAASLSGLQSDYNSVIGRFSDDGGSTVKNLAAWQALGYDLHSFVATPAQHFVSPTSDFHLLATSPAVDTGSASEAPPTDLEGMPRPRGAGFDIGAYERSGAVVPTPTPTVTTPPPPTLTATATRTRTSTVTATFTRTSTATATIPPPTATASASATATRTFSATATASSTATPVIGDAVVSGAVRYYTANRPVPDVAVRMIGPDQRSDTTDPAGAWSIAGVPNLPWRIEPSRVGGRGAAVSALDAAYVLQHVADARALDADQQLACDVTANGTLSALDATRILQLTVGLQTTFGAADACNSDWLFVPVAGGSGPTISGGSCEPGALELASVPGDLAGQDFRAVLIGDCTGNWQPPGSGAARRAVAPHARLRPLGRNRVALVVRPDLPLQAIEAVVEVPAAARIVRARPASGARGGVVAVNERAPGRWHLAYAAPRAIGRGERLVIVLELSGAAPRTVWLRMLSAE